MFFFRFYKIYIKFDVDDGMFVEMMEMNVINIMVVMENIMDYDIIDIIDILFVEMILSSMLEEIMNYG